MYFFNFRTSLKHPTTNKLNLYHNIQEKNIPLQPFMLYVKESTIPAAGKGLFVARDIKKGEIITEYEGERLTWKQCQERNEKKKGKEKGAYYFHINDKNCIDAEYCLWALGRYANDAAGFGRVKGFRNNTHYSIKKGRVFIIASRNIKAGSEIFVPYGKAYWDAMKSVD